MKNIKIADWYELYLCGEPLDSLGCPENYIKIIEKFIPFEKEPDEWVIQAKTGIHCKLIRSMQNVYCRFHNLPYPVRHPKIKIEREPTPFQSNMNKNDVFELLFTDKYRTKLNFLRQTAL